MKIDLERFHQIGKDIEKFIRPATFPLAVKVVRDESEVDFPHKQPSTDLHLQTFVCQNFKMSRTYGWDIIDEKTLEEMKQFPIGLYAQSAVTDEKFGKHLYGCDWQSGDRRQVLKLIQVKA